MSPRVATVGCDSKFASGLARIEERARFALISPTFTGKDVAVSTQNVVLSALLFLYRRALHIDFVNDVWFSRQMGVAVEEMSVYG
jgi:hypothetical protein